MDGRRAMLDRQADELYSAAFTTLCRSQCDEQLVYKERKAWPLRVFGML